MRAALLALAALGMAACLGSTDPVKARNAQLGLTIAASSAPPLDGGARFNVVTPSSVEIVITAPVGGTTTELLRTKVAPDSAGTRVPLRVELGACLGDKDACALTITVRLRAGDVAYDSSVVGPITASPGATIEVPAIRFRPTARLALIDTTLAVVLGRTGTVRVNALDASSQLLLGRALVWRSLDPTIATVDGTGLVSALTQGRARIEAAREGFTVTAVVNATPVEALQLTASASQVTVGDPVTLTPTISVVGGRSTRVTFGSSNPAVATVDTSGRVTTVAAGVAQLSATAVADTTQRAQVTLTVNPERAAVSVRYVSTGSRGSLPGNVQDLKWYAADSVFAVGCGDTSTGFLVRFDGTDWRSINAPGLTCPQGVGRLADGTLLVLNGQTLLSQRNGVWTVEPLPVSGFFTELETVGNTIYVGGPNGTVLQWNGSWAVTSVGTTAAIGQLSAAGDGTVYAATSSGSSAQLYRFSNASWQVVNTGVAWTFITAVQAFSASEVFVGGVANATGITDAFFNGSSWTSGGLPSGFTTLRAFAAAGSVRYAINSGGEVLRRTGSGWIVDQVTGIQQADVVGGSTGLVAAGWNGSSWQLSNGTWRRLSNVPSLTALWAASPTFMLAGGNEGAIEHFDGQAWRSVMPPSVRNIRAIFGADSTDVWVAATSMFYRYRQGTWDSIPHTFGDVSAFWGDRRDRIFAATSAGAILRFDGTAWQQTTTLSAGLLALTGVALPNGSIVLYAGGFGQIFRSNASTWTAEPVAGVNIYSIYAADTGNVFAATGGTLIRRVNGQWGAMGAVSAYWVGGTGPTDLYAGGCDAPQRYDGTSWSALSVTGSYPPVCGYFGGSSHVVFRRGGFVAGQMLRTLMVGVGPQGQTPGVPR